MMAAVDSIRDVLIGLAGCAGAGLAFLIVRDPRLGLLLIAASIPMEAAGRIGYLTEHLALTVSKVLTVVTLGAWLVHLGMRRVRPCALGWMLLLPCFWLAAALSLLGADEQRHGVEALFRLATTVVFFFLVVQLVDSVRVLKLCLGIFVAMTAVFAAYALVQRARPESTFEVRLGWEEKEARRFGVERTVGTGVMRGVDVERSSGVSAHSIVLSLNIALVLAPAMVLWGGFRRGDVRNHISVVLLALFLATTIATYARTGVVLIALGVALMVKWRLIRVTPALMSAVIVGVLVVVAAMPESYRERVFSKEAVSTKEVSIATRLEVVDAAGRQFLDHPILGVGYGNRYGIFDYYTTYPDKEHAVTPHNAYVQMAAQTGLFGVSVLLLFFWKVIVHVRRCVAWFRQQGSTDMVRLGYALCVSVLVFLFSGLAMDLFDKGLPQAWLLVGLSGAYVRLCREQQAEVAGAARRVNERGLALRAPVPAGGVS